MNREKVLLVRAPNLYKSEQWKKQGVLRTPTNLALLSSYIREFGPYEPEILDLERYEINGLSHAADIILSRNSKYIGFTTLTPRFPTILRICDELKKRNRHATTIIGGAHISGRPNDCKYPSIDYGIAGEGEGAFLDLLNALTSNTGTSDIENLIHKDKGYPVKNKIRPFIKNLDLLPLPAWDLLDLKEYLDPSSFEGPHVGVFSSRGCPFDCTFCASKVTWSNRVRYRTIDNVINELSELVNKWNIKNIYFYDDQFAVKESRTIELCGKMTSLGIKYHAQIRADSVTLPVARALKQSGCIYAAIGIESGNEEQIKSVRKKETKDEMRNAVKILKDEGVPVLTSYIIGLPGDTHETIRETLAFARELNTEQMKFMLLTPVPGTDVYEMAVNRGLLDPDDLEQMERTTFYDATAVNLSNVTIADLLHYQDLAYRELDKKL